MTTFTTRLAAWPLERIDALLDTATEHDVLRVLDKAERNLRLTGEDFAVLLSPAADSQLERMAQIAQDITLRQFGRVIQLFTPLYLGNYCTNRCVYCGFNTSNAIHRSMLTMEEVALEGQQIAATGLRQILLLTGDAPKKTPPQYIADAAQQLRATFPNIGVEVYSMSEEEYRLLVDAGVDGFTMFQETYNEALYLELHPAGPKRDYHYRLEAPDRAARAGMRSVNVGALLGLDRWRRDAVYTGLHAEWLQEQYAGLEVALSTPRMRPHEGSFTEVHPATDRELVQYIQAVRLFTPAVGITMSTRERPAFRDKLMRLGVTKMSAGVSTAVGGHAVHHDADADHATAQFDIADTRSVDEMMRAIVQQGYQPVLKSWEPLDAVYACGTHEQV